MNHPNPDRCKDLGALFLMIDGEPSKKELRMMKIDWPNKNLDNNVEGACGTAACHAGWFAWASEKNNEFDGSFGMAADKLAKFIGVDDRETLQSWAGNNWFLWGNKDGRWMFEGYWCFSTDGRVPTLKDIGIHWLKVAERIENHINGVPQ